MTHRTNQRPAPCATCKTPVAAAAGTLVGPPWKVVCQECLPFPAPAAIPVKLTLEAGKIRLEPQGRLGGDRWYAYKTILDRQGVRTRKLGATWQNFAAVAGAADLVAALTEAGFGLDVDPKVTEAIAAAGKVATVDVAAATERMVQVDAELAKRGKSLYPFQRDGVGWLAGRTGALLGDDMGLGKTVQALTAVPASAPVLVICPAVAKGVWEREAAAWRPELRVTKLAGRKSFRWPLPGELVAINYDILPVAEVQVPRAPDMNDACASCDAAMKLHGRQGVLCTEFKSKKEDTFTMAPAPFLAGCPAGLVVILDEAHMVKNPKAKRTASVKAISSTARERGGRAYLLTATPLLNTPPELWNVLSCAGLEKEAFSGNWFGFARVMGGTQKEIRARGGKAVKIWEWDGKPTPAAGEALKRVMLRRMKDDVLTQLPPKTYKTIDVELDDADLQAQMDMAWESYGDELDGVIDGKPASIPFSEISELRARIAKAKIPAMLEVVEQYEEASEPLVVFSAHRAPIEALAGREGWAVIMGGTSPEERTRIENDFQAGRLKGVACTIKAGGVAITLTRAAHILRVDRDWTPALNAQAEDRCRRIGQERAVLVNDLVCQHPLDQQVNELLAAKQALITASVEQARVKAGETVLNAAQVAAKALMAIEGQGDLLARAKVDGAAREAKLAALLERLAAEDAAARAREEAASQPLTREQRFERTVERAAAKQRELDGGAETRGPRSMLEDWAALAIRQLAAMDEDHASEENFVGFSKDCTGMGHALARAVAGGLTDRGWDLCVAVCMRFRGQVGAPPAGRKESDDATVGEATGC